MPLPRLPLLTVEAFRQEARAGVALRKAYATEVKAEGDPGERKLSIRITTASADRQNDTIAADGWKLANYRKNPVVLYGHDYRGLPIARDTGITTDELGLIGHPVFTSPEENPFGAMVHRLLQGGFLNAASVGFAPDKWVFNEETHGIDFLECELLEYSIVPVPANAECLVEARDAGIDLAPLKSFAEEYLARADGPGLWLPKEKAERVLQLLEPRLIVVPRSITPEFVTGLSIAGVKFELEPETAPVLFLPVEVPKEEPVPPAPEPVVPVEPDVELALEMADEPEDKGLVFELVEDEPAAGDGVLEVDLATLRSVIGDAFKDAADEKFAALTGRLD